MILKNEIMTTMQTQESESEVERIDEYEVNIQRTKRYIDKYWTLKSTEFEKIVNEQTTHIDKETEDQTKIVRDITDETIRVLDEKVSDV